MDDGLFTKVSHTHTLHTLHLLHTTAHEEGRKWMVKTFFPNQIYVQLFRKPLVQDMRNWVHQIIEEDDPK